MKHTLFILFAILTLAIGNAKNNKPFKGTFYNKENNITIAIDLYDTTIVSPSYAFLGKLNGYMTGRLYDAWFVTDYKITGDKAIVDFSNDMGSDAQKILFSFNDKEELCYEAQGNNAIRRAENRKWIKLPTKMIFINRDAPKPKKVTKR